MERQFLNLEATPPCEIYDNQETTTVQPYTSHTDVNALDPVNCSNLDTANHTPKTPIDPNSPYKPNFLPLFLHWLLIIQIANSPTIEPPNLTQPKQRPWIQNARENKLRLWQAIAAH